MRGEGDVEGSGRRRGLPAPLTAVRCGPTLRALAAFRSRRDAEAVARTTVRLAGEHPLDITLLAVVGVHPALLSWAPLCGLAGPACLLDELAQSADALARETVALLPGDACVQRAVVRSWRSPVLLEPLRAGVYDALVLGSAGGPGRRAAAHAAGRSGTRLLVAR